MQLQKILLRNNQKFQKAAPTPVRVSFRHIGDTNSLTLYTLLEGVSTNPSVPRRHDKESFC